LKKNKKNKKPESIKDQYSIGMIVLSMIFFTSENPALGVVFLIVGIAPFQQKKQK
jgi:hypothetical protein|tara:strand:- start:1008 stop:1172 length:165 start_codon:yes stop_codon:yes gene_type:complete